ncbi:MAG: hypothetical protein AB1489_03620 [Acidobacteriota bacterium]
MIRILVVICLFALTSLASSDEIISVRLVQDKEKHFIGDPVRIEIGIRHQASNKYEVEIDKEGLGPLELHDPPVAQTHAIDGQLAETQIEITLLPFATGKLPIPPFLIVGSNGEQLQTPPLEMNVETITAPQEQQIKDVRPLPKAPLNGWLQPVVLTVLLASAGLYWLLRVADAHATRWLSAAIGLLTARATPRPVAPVVPRVTLEEEAIAKLRLLIASGLVSTDLKRFYIQLADIMVNYAVARYGVKGCEYTTAELLTLFAEKGVPVLVTSAFEQILTACDLVKFARGQPPVEAAQGAVRQAIDLFKALNFK